MSTHNICFRGEIRKISVFSDEKKHPICCYEWLKILWFGFYVLNIKETQNLFCSRRYLYVHL